MSSANGATLPLYTPLGGTVGSIWLSPFNADLGAVLWMVRHRPPLSKLFNGFKLLPRLGMLYSHLLSRMGNTSDVCIPATGCLGLLLVVLLFVFRALLRMAMLTITDQLPKFMPNYDFGNG